MLGIRSSLNSCMQMTGMQHHFIPCLLVAFVQIKRDIFFIILYAQKAMITWIQFLALLGSSRNSEVLGWIKEWQLPLIGPGWVIPACFWLENIMYYVFNYIMCFWGLYIFPYILICYVYQLKWRCMSFHLYWMK